MQMAKATSGAVDLGLVMVTEAASRSWVYYLEGPSTQHLRTLVPKAINGMVFGTRVLKHWVLGPSGL